MKNSKALLTLICLTFSFPALAQVKIAKSIIQPEDPCVQATATFHAVIADTVRAVDAIKAGHCLRLNGSLYEAGDASVPRLGYCTYSLTNANRCYDRQAYQRQIPDFRADNMGNVLVEALNENFGGNWEQVSAQCRLNIPEFEATEDDYFILCPPR